MSVSVSVLTLSCISIERWYAICHPLKFKSTPSRAKLMIGVIWLIALCILVPELVVLDTHPRYPGVTVLMTTCKPMRWSDNNQEAYQLFISIGLFLCPLMLMFVTYAQIARCLWSNVIPTETSRYNGAYHGIRCFFHHLNIRLYIFMQLNIYIRVAQSFNSRHDYFCSKIPFLPKCNFQLFDWMIAFCIVRLLAENLSEDDCSFG